MTRFLRHDALRRYALGAIDDGSLSELRTVAHAINELRRAEGQETSTVHAGEFGALLLLQDLVAGVVADYLHVDHPEALAGALAALDDELGLEAVDELLAAFLAAFEISTDGGKEPLPATLSPEERSSALEALVVVWQLNRNPALEGLRELFDDRQLAPEIYSSALQVLEIALRQPTRGQKDPEAGLLDKLEQPSKASPRSISGQLSFVLETWRQPIAVPRRRLLRAIDALEEERLRPPPGPGPIELPRETDVEAPLQPGPRRREPAWMSELVLVAKHSHVWLDQLGRCHGRAITRLDQVPDRELARLSELGLNGLWMVGVWERSRASKRIKRLSGDPEAQASAYSIFDYQVAGDLGGDEALAELQDRALQHGIRIGVDVVPNHFGIDSRWLRHHPERFLTADSCPFPAYSFDGPDLSSDPDIGIYLEDHYYDRTDAAVVFRRLDRRSGEQRFVYHGNDGTSTPWNDTAQLDYSRADVREAMTETILGLARRFRILRFDAAMTLTRLHFQRLWFPAPGDGGAVPSRSEYGLSEESFAQQMPTEFWTEVVARVAAEAPDTLLVAEAFWLMEPFFVTELGMDRVYNSAFMHLLRERENESHQHLLRNTAARAPELLRRSVNFLTTPDEASAAEQFGTRDRYFGACTLLATMPGLPLLGHGQIEGLSEKYGMEFLQARSDESPQAAMVERHRREIAPLLAERRDFAGLEKLQVLDFVAADGGRRSEVFVYCVGRSEDARLVVFNNSEHSVAGYVRLLDHPEASEARHRGPELANLLEVAPGGKEVLRLRDRRVDFEIDCTGSELASTGLELKLAPWQALVLRPADS